MLGMIQNSFEEEQFSLDDLYSTLFNGCYVASINCGKVRYDPFILIRLKTEEDRKGIGVGMISIRTVEYAVFLLME